jgi:hypothetical protein
MRSLRIHRLALAEFDRAQLRYEREREGLGVRLLELFEGTIAQILESALLVSARPRRSSRASGCPTGKGVSVRDRLRHPEG